MGQRGLMSKEEARELLVMAGIPERDITPEAESWTIVLMEFIIERTVRKMAEAIVKQIGCA